MKRKGSLMVNKQARSRHVGLRLGALELGCLDSLRSRVHGTPSDLIRFALRYTAAALTKDAQESTEVKRGTEKN